MKIKLSVLLLFTSFFCFFTIQASSHYNYPFTQMSTDIEKRMHAIENGLKKGIQIKGNESPGMNLYDQMKYYDIPGISIAIINNGKIEWAKAYNISSNEEITPETLFQAASISKPFAATVALSLVEKNKINLDQNVNDVLKTWKVTDNQFTENEKVTLRRLLSHTAGLTVHGFVGYSSLSNTIPTLIQILKGEKPANSDPIVVDNTPGKAFSYSGGGYLVAQKVIEDITQKKFNDLAREIVFKPLEMHASSFELIWPSKAGSIAIGHSEEGSIIPGYWNIYPESAAAGLWTTPSDLARFAIEIQTAFNGKSNRILSQSAVRQMLSEQPNSHHFALGLAIKQINDVIEFSHSGGNIGYQCFLVGFTLTGQGAVIMTNSDNGWLIIPEIIRSIGDTYRWPNGYSEQYKIVEPVNVDPNIYKNYVGNFAINISEQIQPIRLTLSTANNKLFITIPYPKPTSENKTFELIPGSEQMFFTVDGGFEIVFSPGNNDEFTVMGMKAHRISSLDVKRQTS